MQFRILAEMAAAGSLLAALLAMPNAPPEVRSGVHVQGGGEAHTAVAAIVFAGRVTDGNGAPLAGVLVRISPWAAATTSDATGRWSLSVRDAKQGDAATLRFGLIGYGEEMRVVRVQGDSVRVDITLSTQSVSLQELVVTGQSNRLERDARAASDAKAVAAPAWAGADVSAVTHTFNDGMRRGDPRDYNTEGYSAIDENPFLGVRTNPLSTFSIDVDRASYANIRRFLREGRLPPKDAVRIEEMVNYFSYTDAEPNGDAPFAVTTELGVAPWRPEHRLLRIGLKAKSVAMDRLPPSNLVFLLDVSGSMNSPDKLPLLKQAFGLLVNELRPQDRVAIVVYAGAAGMVLPSTPGSEKETILAAIERLEAGGSTAGGAGIRLAYDIARQHHVQGGNNRVILATDGDFNVGASSDAEMVRLIEEKRAQGTFLTVLGFGTGNLKDSKMELLADRGNGNYAYIDELMEARKVFVQELGGTLFTVAKDVKLQVEFNSELVRGYRLIGYENRLLAAEDFNDDAKDAGELGAGHSVTALYEIVPVSANSNVDIRGVDPLRYREEQQRTRSAHGELAYVKLRWKKPDGDRSTLMDHPVADRLTGRSDDLTFASAVAAFGMILRDSPHRGETSYEQVLALGRDGLGEDRGGHRTAFLQLVEQARRIGVPIATESDDRIR
jgi:Ca-activated chloride channel homolog